MNLHTFKIKVQASRDQAIQSAPV